MTAPGRATQPDPRRAAPGQVIDGRYELVEFMDGGSFGEVWRARDPRLALDRAVKLLVPHHDPDVAEGDRRRFEREAQLTAAFDGEHHIVKVFDYGEDRGRPYLVMKLMRGENLLHLLSGEGRLDPPRAVRILGQVAEALGEAHRKGLVHRDVKPANVFVEAGDEVTLLDFGMLGALDRRRLRDHSRRGDLGGGTLEYMAPERFFTDDGRPPEAPSSKPGDIYSLGCLLYQCLTGRRPFLGQSEKELQHEHRHGPRPRLGAVVKDRQEFEAVVAQSLAVEPHRRPPSPADFIHDVRDALAAWESRVARHGQPASPAVAPPVPPVDEQPTVHVAPPVDDTTTRPGGAPPPATPEDTGTPAPPRGHTDDPGPGLHVPVLVGGASTGIVGAGAVLLAQMPALPGAVAIAACWAGGACAGWWYGSRGS